MVLMISIGYKHNCERKYIRLRNKSYFFNNFLKDDMLNDFNPINDVH